jgi:hypothetical protein
MLSVKDANHRANDICRAASPPLLARAGRATADVGRDCQWCSLPVPRTRSEKWRPARAAACFDAAPDPVLDASRVHITHYRFRGPTALRATIPLATVRSPSRRQPRYSNAANAIARSVTAGAIGMPTLLVRLLDRSAQRSSGPVVANASPPDSQLGTTATLARGQAMIAPVRSGGAFELTPVDGGTEVTLLCGVPQRSCEAGDEDGRQDNAIGGGQLDPALSRV